MKLTFLGTGTSQGVPVIAGKNCNLDLSNPKNWRTRASIHIEIADKHFQVDAGPEFRIQCLQNDIDWIDCFFLTHGHADHIAGMDDLRRFCDRMPDYTLPVFSNLYGLERIKAMFPYALGNQPTEKGYPCFKIKKIPDSIDFGNGITVKSVQLPHGSISTTGLVFEHNSKKIVYYTDCKEITPKAYELAENADILILDCLRPKPHPSHMCVNEAMAAAHKINSKKTFFTHTTAHIDYDVWQPQMPQNFYLAYDGLSIEL